MPKPPKTQARTRPVSGTVERALFLLAAISMLVGGALQTFKRPELSDLVVTVGFGIGVAAIALAALNLVRHPAPEDE